MIRQIRTAAAPILLGGGAVLAAGCASGPQVGDQAPAFRAQSTSNDEVAMDAEPGKVVVMDFFATWCGPCVRASPYVQALHERYADDPRVEIIAVHYDDNYAKGHPGDYAAEHGYTFTIVPDGADVRRQYGVSRIPTFLIVDQQGEIVHRQTGFSSSDVDKFSGIIDAQL